MEIGSILQRKGTGRPSTSDEDVEYILLELFEHSPHPLKCYIHDCSCMPTNKVQLVLVLKPDSK